MSLHYLVLFLVVVPPGAYSASLKRMSMERMHSSDLEASASGYIYSQASGQPTSYVQFSSHVPSVPVQQYQQYQHVPVYYVQPQVVPEKLVENVEEIDDHEDIEEAPVEELVEADEGDKEEYVEGDKEGYTAGGNAGYGSDGSEFEKSGGEEFQKSHHSSHGEKGDKGYANKHAFSQGEKGAHANQHDEGHYSDKGGKKAGHFDSAGHYHTHHEAGKGEKGEKHGEKASHKKGQKTTGFHNVYHKDEYKKDHTFYDESDKSGFYEKHGGQEAHNSKANGGFKKGASHDSGYHANNYGKNGSHDKGHYNQADQGFKGQNGHEQHHSNFADYAKEGGKKSGQEYGYQHGEEKY